MAFRAGGGEGQEAGEIPARCTVRVLSAGASRPSDDQSASHRGLRGDAGEEGKEKRKRRDEQGG